MPVNGQVFDGPVEAHSPDPSGPQLRGAGKIPAHAFRYCVRRGPYGRHRDIYVWIDKDAPEAIVKSAGRTELQKTLDLGYAPPRIWIDSGGQTTWHAPRWWQGTFIKWTLCALIGLGGGYVAKFVTRSVGPSVPLIGVGGVVVLRYAMTGYLKGNVKAWFRYTRHDRLRVSTPASEVPESDTADTPDKG